MTDVVHRAWQGKTLCGATGGLTAPGYIRDDLAPTAVLCGPCEERQALLDLGSLDLGGGGDHRCPKCGHNGAYRTRQYYEYRCVHPGCWHTFFL